MDLFTGRFMADKPIYQWDQHVAGLGVRLNKDGSRVFVAKLSINGRPRWFTLGSTDMIRTEEARKLVQRMKALAKIGDDPEQLLKAFLRSENLNPAAGVSFGQFVDIYIERYAKVHKRSWLKDKQRLYYYTMPAWGNRRLSEVNRLDVLDLINKIGRTRPYAANRLLETLTTLFKQAIVLCYLPDSHPMPTFGIKRFPEKPRKEHIRLKDFPKLAAALREHKNKTAVAGIYLILYTGLRHQEAVKLRWDYINFEERYLTIPRTKNGEPHTLPLSPSVIAVLNSLPRSSPWVFPSPLTGKHVASFTKAWQKIRAAAGFNTIRIHDLRRSFGILLLEQTDSMPIVRDALNHSNEHVTNVYAFYTRQSLQPVLDEHAKTVDRALGLDSPVSEGNQ